MTASAPDTDRAPERPRVAAGVGQPDADACPDPLAPRQRALGGLQSVPRYAQPQRGPAARGDLRRRPPEPEHSATAGHVDRALPRRRCGLVRAGDVHKDSLLPQALDAPSAQPAVRGSAGATRRHRVDPALVLRLVTEAVAVLVR